MFWKFNLITTSHVETLLSKENVTLNELMDEDDVIQECKAQNKKLIDYIVQSEIMDELVSLITQEPSIELDEVVRYKYPNIACEILTSDVCAINDALAGDQALLSKLMSFLDHKDQNVPLNPLLASFFSKTVSLLITRKTEPMFEFLQGREEFVPLLLEHFDTSAVTDLLLRLITCTENNDTRAALVKWLSEQQLVERLVALIRPCQSEERNTNAAQALCDIVRVCREHMSLFQENADPDPLLQTIESSETISKLLDNMFDGEKKESVLVSGILVILAMLEFKKQGPAGQYQYSGQNNSGGPNSQVNDGSLGPDSPLQCFASLFFRSEGPEAMTSLDEERLTKAVSEVITALLPRMEDLIQLLKTPPQKPSYSSVSLPPIEKPVGFTRLEVAHLISALLNTNTHELNQRLTELNTLPILLDMFFSHSWNNFLHTQVEQAVGTILRNPATNDTEDNQVHPLLDQLFLQCKIVQRILDTWEENEHEQSQPGKHRRGYMGHLTNIANHLSRCSQGPPNCELIQCKLSELPEDYGQKWDMFVTETLTEINNRNQTPLVSGVSFSALDGDNVDFRELHVPFQQEKHLLQSYSDYQMENMTNSFDDQFGFNDEEFVETDEGIPDPLSRVNGNFQLVAEENMTPEELFEQACRERVASLDESDSDEEVWDDKDSNYVSGVNLPAPLRRLAAQGSASSLEENSRDCEEDNSSDSPHVLSNPIGIVGVSEHPTPDSSIPITAPSGSIVSLGARNTFISPASNQTRHVHDDQTMDVDSSDVWTATYSGNESTAMDTSSPWNGDVASSPSTTVISVPQAGAPSGSEGWADFSCFNFSRSDGVQAGVETSQKRSKSEDESLETSATSQSREEVKPGLSSLGGQPLANGQLPVMSSGGPVVVVVGNPNSAAPLPVEDFQQQQPSGVPDSSPALPPSPVASSKMNDDPARASASTLLQPGSQEEGSSVTEAVNNPTVEPLTASPACLQNGPI